MTELNDQEKLIIEAYRAGAAIDVTFLGSELDEETALNWCRLLNDDVETVSHENGMAWYKTKAHNIYLAAFHENSLTEFTPDHKKGDDENE